MVSIKCCSLIDAYVDADNGSDNSKTHQLLWFYKDIVFIPLLLIYVILESEKTVVSKWTRRQTNRNTFFYKKNILAYTGNLFIPRYICIEKYKHMCTGKTQRDGMEREVGGGIRMGNICKSMADSCQCMAKTTKIL